MKDFSSLAMLSRFGARRTAMKPSAAYRWASSSSSGFEKPTVAWIIDSLLRIGVDGDSSPLGGSKALAAPYLDKMRANRDDEVAAAPYPKDKKGYKYLKEERSSTAAAGSKQNPTDTCAAPGCGRDRTYHTGPFHDPLKPAARHLFETGKKNHSHTAPSASLIKASCTIEQQVRLLTAWEVSRSFSAGFVWGCGGLITLPLTLPASIGTSWVLQARLSGAIAELYGHDSSHDHVRALILASLAGDDVPAGVVSEHGLVAKFALEQIPLRIPASVVIAVQTAAAKRLSAQVLSLSLPLPPLCLPSIYKNGFVCPGCSSQWRIRTCPRLAPPRRARRRYARCHCVQKSRRHGSRLVSITGS